MVKKKHIKGILVVSIGVFIALKGFLLMQRLLEENNRLNKQSSVSQMTRFIKSMWFIYMQIF